MNVIEAKENKLCSIFKVAFFCYVMNICIRILQGKKEETTAERSTYYSLKKSRKVERTCSFHSSQSASGRKSSF